MNSQRRNGVPFFGYRFNRALSSYAVLFLQSCAMNEQLAEPQRQKMAGSESEYFCGE
jgi:hypothetical protein